MIRKHFRFRRLVVGLALGLAVAVSIAPAVQAKPISGQPPVQTATPSQIAPDNFGPLDPWAYAVLHKGSPSVPQDVRDHRLVGQLVQSERSATQSGFDYGDAGIGAGVAFGAAMLLMAAFVLGRRFRSLERTKLATS